MGFFDFFKGVDINQGVAEWKETPGSVLLDVRTEEEYREGRVPESRNLPLQNIDRITSVVKDKAAAVFVYCHSGARSSQAAALLKRMGYTNVKNIGGIMNYSGKVER